MRNALGPWRRRHRKTCNDLSPAGQLRRLAAPGWSEPPTDGLDALHQASAWLVQLDMHNVCEWFEGGYDKLAPEDRRSLLFIWNREILEQSATPLAALHHFLAERAAGATAGDEDGQMRL